MSYAVKEIYATLQGEGAHTGRRAVFLRFAGCNLWTGREGDRATAPCNFCDTDFVGMDGPGGGRFADAAGLADAVAADWGTSRANRYVVCTGGEPLLQVDDALVDALHDRGFEIGVETNGTQVPPPGIDWLCVSPKVGADLVVTGGQELKFVYPQQDADPTQFETLTFDSFRLQPMDSPDLESNVKAAVEFCLEHPNWNLSLKTHKYIGIP